jgi:hypothetical protein
MTTRESDLGMRLGRVGGIAGLIMGCLLTARVIQVQLRPGRGGLGFALLGGLLVIGPYAGSVLGARRFGTVGIRATWIACGIVCMGVGILSPASYPLILCGGLLVAGALTLRGERHEVPA